MAKCQVCGKKTVVGRNSKHHRGVASKKFARRARKRSKAFRPNIQKATITVGGLKMKMRLCTNCLKKIRGKVAEEKKEKPAEPVKEKGAKREKTPIVKKEKKLVKPAKSRRKKTEKK